MKSSVELECVVCKKKFTRDKSEANRNAKLERASLDRIDNSKGYTKDNVRFVSMMANMAKNNFSDEDLLSFCEAVVSFKNEQL